MQKKIQFVLLTFHLSLSALNNTQSHCGTRLRGSVPTPPGMKTAPRVEWTRPAFVRLLHPGSKLCRQWRPPPPEESPSCPRQSRQTQTDWSTPSPWSGRSRLKSHWHRPDSTGSRRVIHIKPSDGPAWHTETRRRVLLLETAKPAEKESNTLKHFKNSFGSEVQFKTTYPRILCHKYNSSRKYNRICGSKQ